MKRDGKDKWGRVHLTGNVGPALHALRIIAVGHRRVVYEELADLARRR